MRKTRIIKTVGWLVLAAAIIFVAHRISLYVADLGAVLASGITWVAVATATPSPVSLADLGAVLASGITWVAVATATIAYVAILSLRTAAWGVLLTGASARGVTATAVLDVYGRSQIAKYFPGNIFHFAGRQVLGRGKGWPQGALAVASFLEIAILGAAAASITLLLGRIAGGAIFEVLPSPALLVGGLVAVFAPWLFLRVSPHLPGLKHLNFLHDARDLTRGFHLLAAFVLYAIYFILFALVFWGFSAVLGYATAFNLFPSFAVAILAGWLLGYVTPSAPGGLGVREAVIILLLGPTIGEADALVLAIVFRLVTTAGDTLYLLAALGSSRWWRGE